MAATSHEQGGSKARRKSSPIASATSHPSPGREINVVFASTGCTDPSIVEDVLPRLAALPDISVRAILDSGYRGQDFITASSCCTTMANVRRQSGSRDVVEVEQEAAELCEWADLLVLAPIDANNMAKMLNGATDNLLQEILRSWNVSKKILMVPGMSALMWENPMTKKQLTKIRRKWNWIQVLQPLLWKFEGSEKRVISWEAAEDLRDAVCNQINLLNIGQDVVVSPSQRQAFAKHTKTSKNILPPELWTMIIDFTGDWELAQTLHIYTNLPPPADWTSHTSPHGPRNYMEALELTILRGNLKDVEHFIATHSVPRWLSKLCIKLIMRFAMTSLLAHLEANHRDLFWTTFGHTFLPDTASAVFGRTEILEFWRTSPSFLTKEYNFEALDGASRAGFVAVLEWWQHSGLPLKFTEAALEQASSQGHLQVLEWWKAQSTTVDDSSASVDSSKVRLKPGKSIAFATQNGHADVVRWWLRSGIAFGNEDAVPKLASTHGHTEILRLWHEAKGDKMIFDNQVLVGATKNGNVGVLEWWKRSGLKVEYKTCDVEEALEDGDAHFPDGDVLILITSSRRYKLHSSILRRSSPTFAALLDEQTATVLSKNARKKGVTTRFRLHLVDYENAGYREGGVEAPTHVLRRIPLDENGSAVGDYPDLLGDAIENGRVVQQFVLAWEQVLGALYNRTIDIGDNERDGIDYILESAGTILTAAECLNSPTIVTRPIEASLLSLSQVLHRSIASNPTPWLDFSFRLRSKTLWKESLIHGAGRFNSPQIQSALASHDLHPSIVEVLTKKAQLLKTLSQRTQSNLLSYYPEALQRTKTVGRADRDSIGRASYANDIMQWVALSVWRHWLAQQVSADNTHHAADMGFEFFRLISRAGEAYLDRNQLRQFHDYFPMSLKGESVVENRVSELKAEGQGMVRKVLENHSYLDVEKFPAGHMTCTWVGPEDYPWETQSGAGAAGDGRSARGTAEPSEFGGSWGGEEAQSVLGSQA